MTFQDRKSKGKDWEKVTLIIKNPLSKLLRGFFIILLKRFRNLNQL